MAISKGNILEERKKREKLEVGTQNLTPVSDLERLGVSLSRGTVPFGRVQIRTVAVSSSPDSFHSYLSSEIFLVCGSIHSFILFSYSIFFSFFFFCLVWRVCVDVCDILQVVTSLFAYTCTTYVDLWMPEVEKMQTVVILTRNHHSSKPINHSSRVKLPSEFV